jgi:hypothetical protein
MRTSSFGPQLIVTVLTPQAKDELAARLHFQEILKGGSSQQSRFDVYPLAEVRKVLYARADRETPWERDIIWPGVLPAVTRVNSKHGRRCIQVSGPARAQATQALWTKMSRPQQVDHSTRHWMELKLRFQSNTSRMSPHTRRSMKLNTSYTSCSPRQCVRSAGCRDIPCLCALDFRSAAQTGWSKTIAPFSWVCIPPDPYRRCPRVRLASTSRRP